MGDVKALISSNEKIYKSIRDLTYLFQEGDNKSYLIVVFSSVNPPNTFAYNYINTLEHLPYNKIFILDNFGEQGAYYLGENLDFSIETSVVSLINYYANKYDICNKNIIVAGSSKGGYSSLYYGIKYGYGNIIAGGPQTKLGDFLYDQVKGSTILNYILPEINEENKGRLNSLLYDIINEDNIMIPNINIHIGSGDHHYKNHVIPFIKYLDKFKKEINLEIIDYIGHDGVRKYYPSFLCRCISEIVNYPLEKINPIKIIDIKAKNDELIINAEVEGEVNNYEYAYYIYKDNKIIHKEFYSNNYELKRKIYESGEYKVKLFLKFNNVKYTQMSDSIVI